MSGSCREAVGERLQERDDLVLLLIRQAEIAGRAVEILRHLRPRPAVHLLGRSRRAVSGLDVVRIEIARIVEVHELLEALDVPLWKNSFWKYGPGASVVGHCGGVMATSRAVDTWNWPSTLGASGVQLEFGLGAEPNPLLRKVPSPRLCSRIRRDWRSRTERIRRGLIEERIPRIQGHAFIGRAEAREQRLHGGGLAGVALTRSERGPSAVEVTGIAVAFAVEQLVTGHLVCGQCVLPRQEPSISTRRRSRLLRPRRVERLPPVIERLVCPQAVFRFEADRRDVPAERRSTSGSRASPRYRVGT